MSDLGPPELCRKAGRHPSERITQFVLEDYAAALMDGDTRTEEQIVDALKAVRCAALETTFLCASEWVTIFKEYADSAQKGGTSWS